MEIQKFMNIDHFLSLMRLDFEKNKQRNPAYTLRQYAKKLGVSPGSLSEILRGKRRPGMQVYQKILTKIEVAEQEVSPSGTPSVIVREDELRMIQDWYHFALIDLLKLKQTKKKPEFLAPRLGISELKVVTALERLQRLGLVFNKAGLWYATHQLVSTTTDIPSSAIREGFRQDLRKAEEALDECKLDLRDFSTLTLTFDTKKMADAKVYLKKMRRDFLNLFASENADEVYQLSTFLLPITKAASTIQQEKQQEKTV
jgi:transcriptional regulator with XRE-family HTH domain